MGVGLIATIAFETLVRAAAIEVGQMQSNLVDRCLLTQYANMVRKCGEINIWTEALQSALREHQIVVIPASNRKYYLDATVVLPSGRRIEASGATVRLVDGVRTVMFRNDHVLDGTLRPIPRGTRDSNITIDGGRFEDWCHRRLGYGDSGRYDGTERRKGNFLGVSTLFFFNNCDNLQLKNLTIANAGGFAVQTGDGDRHVYENLHFERCFADGLHLNGNLSCVLVRNVRGQVGDDLVAFNAYDWLRSSVNFGPQRDIVCEGLELVREADFKTYPAIRLQPAKFRYADGTMVDCSISNIVLRNVRGITTFKGYFQTPRYDIGKVPEWGAVGSGWNWNFEDISIDLTEPIDKIGQYASCEPKRGHFGAFEFGANLSGVKLKDVAVCFHVDRYPLSHLMTVGPKSCVVKGTRGQEQEIFDPYASCRVSGLVLENVRTTGIKPEDLVHETAFDDVNKDGRSTGRGMVVRPFGSKALAVMSNVVVRSVISRERIDLDLSSPGARPFPGADVLSFRTEPAFSGEAVLTLSSESPHKASAGKKTKFTAVATNGVVRFPCRLPYEGRFQYFGVEFKPKADSAREPVTVCEGAGEFWQTAAEAMRVEIDTGNRLGIVRAEKSAERPVLVIRNPAKVALRWKTDFRFVDVFGRSFEMPFDRTVGGGETIRLPIQWPVPAKGVWYMTADVRGADGSCAMKEARFAWIDLHEVSPIASKPKFRLGIHWHGAKYYPNYVDPTIDAMVAAGAKLTRTDYGFMFHAVCPRAGTWNWDCADDLLSRIRRAGLSADIIIGGTPAWAVDSDVLAKRRGLSRLGCLPTTPGVFRDFCEAIARRYGTRIDYYENGNEWDLTPHALMTEDEGIRMQREAYEGVHAGCPDACVIPNGWCAAATTAGLKNLKAYHPGLIEAFAAHPEYYDAWAYHSHGLFHWYEINLQNQFLPLRARTGLKTRPWFANETAVTIFKNGEACVARNVWQKILYAWAWGAQDYVWYNLRATGWFDASEPGYGLMTADLRPRATYAAFAALAALFQGLDADGRIFSRKNLHLLRFKGEKSGFRGLVLGGWDYLAKASRTVHIRTDARFAETSDHMGNRRAVDLLQGVVELELSADPVALVLHGATMAEAVDLSEFADRSEAAIDILPDIGDRAPDFTIRSSDQMKDFNVANPAVAHRVWMGPADLSAKIWLGRKGTDLVVKAEVEDDVAASGDGLHVLLEPKLGSPIREIDVMTPSPHVKTNRTRKGNGWIYEVVIGSALSGLDDAGMKEGFGFSVHILEDDGEGPDGWLELVRGSNPLKRIRFSK